MNPIFQRDCVPCHTGIDEDPKDEDDGEEMRAFGDLLAARMLVTVASNDPGLESCRSVVNNIDDVITTVFIDNDMPPGAWPRLTSAEKLTVERWISGGALCD